MLLGAVARRCAHSLLLALFVEHTQAVSVLAVLATDNIAQLLEAFTADVEAFGGSGLGWIIAEEDEGL